MVPATEAARMAEAAGIYARESAYLGRYVHIGVAGNRVISLSFPLDVGEGVKSEHPMLDRIERYLDGGRDSFQDVELAMTISTDHRAVLDAVRQIPYGTQRSVEGVARITPDLSAEEEADLETVRAALVENPVPLIIPDHRVRNGPSAAPAEVEQRLRALEGL